MDLSNEITIIVVNFNTKDLLRRCLRTVKSIYPYVEVIVVDNGSSDGSVEWLREFAESHPYLKLILLKHNIFHGPALDKGIQSVKTPYFFTLDSDAWFKEPGALEACLVDAERFGAYAVGYSMPVNSAGKVVKRDSQDFMLDYIHPFAALFNRDLYSRLPPFEHHGAPLLKNQVEAFIKGFILSHFDMLQFLGHQWRGTDRTYGYYLSKLNFLQKIYWCYRYCLSFLKKKYQNLFMTL